ncbi:MAG TPA: peptide chain release factor 1 [Phototrophicaceae bacterium]|nr:peptide chain release factor 1 [Phototrophicaceae bacterium]
MLDKLAGIEGRYDELEQMMSDPAVVNDYTKVAEYSKERAGLEELVETFRTYRYQMGQLENARTMVQDESDADLIALAQEEITELEASTVALEEKLKRLLVPKDPRDDKNVIMEIRAGAGGDEAGLFAADLFRMYSYYAEKRGWKTEVIEQSDTGVGGFKQIVFEVKGKGAYSRLKYESGVHRVQRVPETEAQGRIHTSTVTVAVLAEIDEVDVQLRPDDIHEEFTRAAGAGGQHVQKNSTAVRLVHIPSGLVVEVQDERSQLQNRMRARQILLARLYDMEIEKQRSEQDSERRSQVGTGERSEKIRTYNYPQNRVTDHRVNVSSYNLPAIMQGEIDEFVDELITQDQAERLSSGVED